MRKKVLFLLIIVISLLFFSLSIIYSESEANSSHKEDSVSNNINFESLRYMGESIGWILTLIINPIVLIFIYWLTKRDKVENDFEIKKNCFINLLSDIDNIIEIEKPHLLGPNFQEQYRNFDIKNNLNSRFNYNLVKVLRMVKNKDFYRLDEDLREIINEIKKQYVELKAYTYNSPHNFYPKEREAIDEKTLDKDILNRKWKHQIPVTLLLSHLRGFSYKTYDVIDHLLVQKDSKKHFEEHQVLIEYINKDLGLNEISSFKSYNFIKKMNKIERAEDYLLKETEIYETYFYCNFKKEIISPFLDNIDKFFDIIEEKKKKYKI